MNKIIIIIALFLGVLVGGLVFKGNTPFGAISREFNTYSGGVTNSSTTVGVGATSILSRNLSRQWAKICNDGSGVVWIYETATNTGVVVNMGYPIASSTAYEHCYTIDNNHHYIGQVYGISSATSVVKYIEK